MKKSFIICIIAVTSLIGCVKVDINEVLLQREDISITVNGELQMSYDEGRCQLAYNNRTNEYRVIDDNIGNWFIITCSQKPSTIGQTMACSVSWTTSSSTETRKGIDFEVKNTDGSGRIWMWCESENIGVIIQDLQ